jgi:signal transduction histidine kinase
MRLPPVLLVARRFSGWIAAAMCVSAAVLVWVGYRSVHQWKDAAAAAALSRAQTAADLLASAVTHDMRGVQQVVLASADRDGLVGAQPIDLLPIIGSAFARYPYPEAFFSWRADAAPETVSFYTRSDRPPAWIPDISERKLAPVVLANNGTVARQLMSRVDEDGRLCKRLSVFDIQIGNIAYQGVAAIAYGSNPCDRVTGVLGFLVDMSWVRRSYFNDLAEQITQLAGGSGARLLVFDEQHTLIAGEGGRLSAIATRSFPLAFFDPLTVEFDPPHDLRVRTWTAAAAASDDPALVAAEGGAQRTLVIDAALSFVLVVAMFITAQAARASVDLSEMRSDLVSTVTHELKTPISNIRAINETLASGKGDSVMSREYAELAVSEAKRLGRLIDNLLAYARITDVTDAYFFESVSVEHVVGVVLAELRGQLQQAKFTVDVDIPAELPDVRADPTALGLVLSNVIDNAIRYSTVNRQIRITATVSGACVAVDVMDRGIGIPADELSRVTRKFFRGRSSHIGGSGLGLAIVERLVRAHDGSLDIQSVVGTGTTVRITLRRWEQA